MGLTLREGGLSCDGRVHAGGVDGDLLPIGQFARLGRLSVKQLRHYDELGLLRPAYVDAGTGYRYYRAEQAREALSIALLRSLEVPLPVVGRVLGGERGALGAVRVWVVAEVEGGGGVLVRVGGVLAGGVGGGGGAVGGGGGGVGGGWWGFGGGAVGGVVSG
ncbi:hypothetical protein DMB42_24560 [Nonomuraea sp. WAC 01424]|nr:hypothetical protein DMB42_24560 [Nonomuraea sp. WAC 01424]